MTPAILLAAALSTTMAPVRPLGDPVSDTDLASVTSGPAMSATPLIPPSYGVDRTPIGDEIDCWWAYDGMALIADAVEPIPTAPAWLDMSRLRPGDLSLRLNMTISTATLPQ